MRWQKKRCENTLLAKPPSFDSSRLPGFLRLSPHALPVEVQAIADKSFALLKSNSKHPSLHFKKVGRFWSAPPSPATGLSAHIDAANHSSVSTSMATLSVRITHPTKTNLIDMPKIDKARRLG